jgi:putative flippase GtrA
MHKIQQTISEPEYELSGDRNQYHSVIQPRWKKLVKQFVRFGFVGGFNTALDLLILNILFVILPTNETRLVLVYTAIAYGTGAINSFLLNKYWTFRNKSPLTWSQIVKFMATTVLGMFSNTTLVWLLSLVPHPFLANTLVWTNISKVLALAISAFVSFAGTSLWVFDRGEKHI